MLGGNSLRESLQRQVGGDDARELLLLVVERYAVGGYQVGT